LDAFGHCSDTGIIAEINDAINEEGDELGGVDVEGSLGSSTTDSAKEGGLTAVEEDGASHSAEL